MTLPFMGEFAAAATPPSFSVVAQIKIPDPEGVAVDTSNHNLYVVSSTAPPTIQVIDESGDADNGKVKAIIRFADAGAIAVDSSNHNLYVAGAHGVVSVIDESGDANTGKVVGVSSPPIRALGALTVDPVNHNVYAVSTGYERQLGAVSVIDESGDADNGKVTQTISVAMPGAIAVDPVNHNVYVADVSEIKYTYSPCLAVIDESGDARTGRISAFVNTQALAYGVAVDPVSHNVYVSSYTSDQLVVVDESGDASSGTVTARINLSGIPSAVAVDPSNQVVYVTTVTTLQVVDESDDADRGKVIETVRTPGAFSVIDDPSRDQAYVDSYKDRGLVSVIGQVAPADLAIAIDGPKIVADNTSFNETVTVTDRGPDTTNAVTNFSIPNGLEVVSAPGATVTSGILVWRDPSLAAGVSAVHQVTFLVDPGSLSSFTLGGVTESSTPDPNLSNNVAIATVQVS